MFNYKIIKFFLLFLILINTIKTETKQTKLEEQKDISDKTLYTNKIDTQKAILTSLKTSDIEKDTSSKINEKSSEENIKEDEFLEEISDEEQKEDSQDKDKDKKEKIKKDIYLNFENTELANFINYMSELKKINLIPDRSLTGVKVSLTIREPLDTQQAWNVFLTIIEMGGFSIVKRGNVYVVIPKTQKRTQPLPSFINVPIDTLPESDENIRYVTFLQNINVSNITEILSSMLSPESSIIPYPEVNGMIITDKSLNIKSGMKIIRELDQTGLQESVVVMKLKRANATDVKKLFDSLINKQDTPAQNFARLLGRQAESTLEYFSPTTRIIAEERTNSLILLGNQKSIKKIEDFIVNHVDTELKGTESPLHIYELQYADASQIKDILQSVTDPSGLEASGQQAGKYGAVRGGVKYFKKMLFQVDKDGNRLIVSSTDKQDWKLLKKTIEDLDKPQPQVAVEALIVTVAITDSKKFGGALRNKIDGQIGKGINFQSPTYSGVVTADSGKSLLGNMLDGIVNGLGSTVLSFGPSTNIWGIFEALKSLTNISVLSQPFFTVQNKTKAHIQVGSEQQVVNEVTGDSEDSFKGYKYVKAATTLDVTPQINLDGILRLNINLTYEVFTDPELGNKDTKNVTTDVTIADGQVLALGGFIKTKATETENKTPLLGDIPILGWLFKNKRKVVSKDYILIFLAPTIIKPRTTPGMDLYTRMKLHSAKNDIEEAVEMRKTNDPIQNWFFNPEKENYSHKVEDFANARYQPTTVDIKNDPYYRSAINQKNIKEESGEEEKKEKVNSQIVNDELIDQQRKKLKKLISSNPIIPQEQNRSLEGKTKEIYLNNSSLLVHHNLPTDIAKTMENKTQNTKAKQRKSKTKKNINLEKLVISMKKRQTKLSKMRSLA